MNICAVHLGSRYTKQLYGWLGYAFASEVFVIVSLTLFLPICLEQFARDNGFLPPDYSERCLSMSATAQEGRCRVKIGPFWMDTASFSLYVYSMSVALQALTVISTGGIADRRQHRKPLLFIFAVVGSLSAMGFLVLPSLSPVWMLSALLAILANVGFGASVVAMNAYLPSLARNSAEVVKVLAELRSVSDSEIDNEATLSLDAQSESGQSNEPASRYLSEPLLPQLNNRSDLQNKYHATLSAATSRISSFGIALGYAAGIFVLVLSLIPVTQLHGSTFSLRLAIGVSGIWWLIFSVPAAIWLPSRGDFLEVDDDPVWSEPVDLETFQSINLGKEIFLSWKRLLVMLQWSEIRKLSHTFRFLAAWFLLSDGFTTITSTAILFGKTVLNMQSYALILIGIITPTSGILGSLTWPLVQRHFGWSNLRILVTLVILISLVPAYGCLGFLNFFYTAAKFGGLTTQGEMYGLAVYFGFIYGAFQSYARAFYAELIPVGEEARWFGLYSITDKSSSFLGPLIVGLIADATGNIRYSFFFLTFMVWLAIPVLTSVDVDRGREDAEQYRYLESIH